MTLYTFNLLPTDRQLVAVFDTGSFLATRWEEEDAVNLYHLAGPGKGVFVELYYATHANAILRIRAFTNPHPLIRYTDWVQLPPLGES
jgi:hypothetical protein